MVDKLLDFKELLKIASMWMDVIRDFGYAILRMLGGVVDTISGASKSIYNLLNFYNYEQISTMIDTYQPVILGLGGVALAFFGWQLIVTHKFDKDKIITNIVMAFTIFYLLPWGMQQGASLTKAGVNLLYGNSSASTVVFQNNITDLYTVDKNEWVSTDVQNDLEEDSDLDVLDISEKVDTGSLFFDKSPLSDEGKKLLKTRVVKVNDELTEANMKSFWKFGDLAYYRYSWHPFLIFTELVTKIIVYCFVIFKSARIVNELGLLYMVSTGISLTDIKDGQRNKQLVIKIRDSFIILYFLVFLINFFDMWSAFIASSYLNSFVKLIAVAAGAWGVIDGPNFLEQLFGIDAGLSSVGRTVIAMSQGGSAVKGAASGASKAFKSLPSKVAGAGKKAARTAAYPASAFKGALDGFRKGGQSPTPPPAGTGGNTPSTPKSSPTRPTNQQQPFSETPPSGKEGGSQPTSNSTPKPSFPEGTSPSTPVGGGGAVTGSHGTSASSSKPTSSSIKPPLANKGATGQVKGQKDKPTPITPPAKQPLSSVSSGLKAKQALAGNTGSLQVPEIGSNQLPKQVQDSKEAMIQDNLPRVPDSETLGDKVVGKYAKAARTIDNGTTMTRSRKVYDVSRATASRVSDAFKD